MISKQDLRVGNILYYARIMPKVGVYDVCELIVRTLGDNWFVGLDKRDKRAYLFSYNDLNKRVYVNRKCALAIVQEAEKNKTIRTFTIDKED